MTWYRSMGAEHEGKGFEVVLEGEWNMDQPRGGRSVISGHLSNGKKNRQRKVL